MTENPKPFQLLFVCTGNTCRSPLAEALARRALEERGWTGIAVRSAGVAAAGGGPASPGSIAVAEEIGLDLESHRSRPLTPELVEWADLILAMSPGHLGPVALLGGEGKVALLGAFARGEEEGADADGVSDPFGGSVERYRATREELEALVDRVIDRLAPLGAP